MSPFEIELVVNFLTIYNLQSYSTMLKNFKDPQLSVGNFVATFRVNNPPI